MKQASLEIIQSSINLITTTDFQSCLPSSIIIVLQNVKTNYSRNSIICQGRYIDVYKRQFLPVVGLLSIVWTVTSSVWMILNHGVTAQHMFINQIPAVKACVL